jgi:hypothetical protein
MIQPRVDPIRNAAKMMAKIIGIGYTLFPFMIRDCYSRRRVTAAFYLRILKPIYYRLSLLFDYLGLMTGSSALVGFFL